LLDAVPLRKKRSDDIRGDDIRLGCATAPEHAIAFVNEDDGRPVSPGLLPDLPDTS
jgi:hypothetical protein